MQTKPRNYVVLSMLKAAKKSGIHKKSEKSKRIQEKIALKKRIYDSYSK
jgi:hypothetical protein